MANIPGLDTACDTRITIACLEHEIQGLRNDLYEISRKIPWILGMVKANAGDVDKAQQLLQAVQELDAIALKVGDLLDATSE